MASVVRFFVLLRFVGCEPAYLGSLVGLLCLLVRLIVKHILFEPSKRSSRPIGSCPARLAERGHECMVKQEVDLRS